MVILYMEEVNFISVEMVNFPLWQDAKFKPKCGEVII